MTRRHYANPWGPFRYVGRIHMIGLPVLVIGMIVGAILGWPGGS